jgi:hypothetical protein
MLEIGKFNIRIVNKGDRYGREDCLTHDDDRQMVEFYDCRSVLDDYERYSEGDWQTRGQFVSRYFVGTILGKEGFYGRAEGGLCLDGGNPNEWSVSEEGMDVIRAYLKTQEQTV